MPQRRTLQSAAQSDPRQQAWEGMAAFTQPLFQTQERALEVSRRRMEAEPTTQAEREAYRPFLMKGMALTNPDWAEKDRALAVNTILQQSTRRDIAAWDKTIQFMEGQQRVEIAGRPQPGKPVDILSGINSQEKLIWTRLKNVGKTATGEQARAMAISEWATGNPGALPGVQALGALAGTMTNEQFAAFIERVDQDDEARGKFESMDRFTGDYLLGLRTSIIRGRDNIPYWPDWLVANFFRPIPPPRLATRQTRGPAEERKPAEARPAEARERKAEAPPAKRRLF